MTLTNTVVGETKRLNKPELGQRCTHNEDGSCTITTAGGASFLIDAIDAERVMALRWYAQQRAHTTRFMACASWSDAPVQIGRLIAGTPAGQYADHINGDATDNRRANLRNCTPAENSANSHLRSNKTIPYKGVSEHRPGRFRAVVKKRGRVVHLGVGDSAEAAARLYDDYARANYGSFARLNFPRPGENSARRDGR